MLGGVGGAGYGAVTDAFAVEGERVNPHPDFRDRTVPSKAFTGDPRPRRVAAAATDTCRIDEGKSRSFAGNELHRGETAAANPG